MCATIFRWFPVLALAAALGLVTATAARAQDEAGFEVGDWSGGPVQVGDGRLGCAVQRDYDGVFLTVVIGGGDEALLLIGDAALAEAGAGLAPARVRIGERFETEAEAEIQESVALVPVSPPGAFLEAFQRGNELTLDIGGQAYGFALSGTMAAIERARECVAAVAVAAVPAAERVLMGALVPGTDVERFGAIAISPGTAVIGTAWNQISREAAEATAREACGQGDCEILVWFGNACGAVAVSLEGATGSDWGNSMAEAQTKALAICEAESGGACAIVESRCTD